MFCKWIKKFFKKEATNPIETIAKQKRLWYPERVLSEVSDLKMKTRGKYEYGFPKGAVIHFTAGRSRDNTRCKRGRPHLQQGIQAIKSAITQQAYCYFLIDRDGNVFQNFPLDEWGYHAGKSSYTGITGNVSDDLVGIELQSAGKLQSAGDGKYAAWFTRTDKGDGLFSTDEIRTSKGIDNQEAGTYHAFTEAQEKSLFKLLRWLHTEGDGIFKYDFVVGHDEVAPGRKNDPGAALSMTMPELRSYLKKGII